MNDPIHVGGLVPLTTIDFPGRLSAVIFCQGCPWRCRYCHSSHLQPFAAALPRDEEPAWPWSRVLAFLEQRRSLLDGVVFSGGEPTYQENLPAAMQAVKAMGYEIGLHTAAPDPALLESVLPYCDWVGMDIKAPFDRRYDVIVGRRNTGHHVLQSLRCLLRSGVDYTLRTTVHPLLLTETDLVDIDEALENEGASSTKRQRFRSMGCYDVDLNTYI